MGKPEENRHAVCVPDADWRLAAPPTHDSASSGPPARSPSCHSGALTHNTKTPCECGHLRNSTGNLKRALPKKPLGFASPEESARSSFTRAKRTTSKPRIGAKRSASGPSASGGSSTKPARRLRHRLHVEHQANLTVPRLRRGTVLPRLRIWAFPTTNPRSGRGSARCPMANSRPRSPSGASNN